MGLDFAIDELFATGWSALDTTGCESEGGRWVPSVDRVMREFEQRVLLQMSATDSSTLIDSPRANTLGINRALRYSEVSGGLDVFRPYALPETAWPAWLGR